MAQVPNVTSALEPLHRTYHGCSTINAYSLEQKLGEGTFGEVYRARAQSNNQVYALKKIIMHNEKEGFPITALREIKILKKLSHENIIRLEEMAVERHGGDPQDKSRKRAVLYMVFPYMHHDLSGLLDNPDVQLKEANIKCYMQQLLRGLKYLHNSKILHRDMKAANLLINNRGLLQIADFGLARVYDEPPPQRGKGNGEAQRDYTCLVVTRWYRPPELLLQLRRYTPAVDMWGAGCVFGEMFKRKPILTGKSDLHQAEIIWDLMGSPSDENMPGWKSLPGCDGFKAFVSRKGNVDKVFRELSPEALSLLTQLLRLDWKTRINAIDALEHPYFKTKPLPSRPEEIPRFNDSHELDRRNARGTQQALPPAPAGGTVGGGANNGEWPHGQQHNGRGWRHDDHRGGQSRGEPHQDNRYSGGRGPPGANDGHRGGGQPRRPGWQDEAPPPQQHNRGSGPPHPPTSQSQLPRHPLPPRPVKTVDTYIPSYRGEGHEERRSREPDDRGAPPSGGVAGAGGIPGLPRRPPPPADERYSSRGSWERGDGYRDRDREYQDRGPPPPQHRDRRTRSRSRSPRRERDYREGYHRERERDYRR